MNNMLELNAADADAISGGIEAYLLGVTVALGGFVVSNWPAIKQGFADGFNDAYMKVMTS
jgi:hypothetical protein